MKVKHPEKVAGCECSYCAPPPKRRRVLLGRTRVALLQLRLRAEVWLHRRGVGFYSIKRGQAWFTNAGRIQRFWGVHVCRLGIAITWRAK